MSSTVQEIGGIHTKLRECCCEVPCEVPPAVYVSGSSFIVSQCTLMADLKCGLSHD